MAISVVCIFAVAIYLFAALLGRIGLSPLHLAVYTTPFLILSVHSYTGTWHIAGVLAGLVLCFLAGYLALSVPKIVSSNKPISPTARNVSRTPPDGSYLLTQEPRGIQLEARKSSSAPILIFFVFIITVYHFSKVGLPILSRNVETARYNIGASGLFGIPSRTYLFGIPMLVAYCAADARTRGAVVYKDRYVRLSALLLIASRLVSGFKSGLLEAMVLLLLIWILSVNKLKFSKYLGRAIIAAILGIGAVAFIGSHYSTYNSNGLSLAANIESRITNGSAAPPAIVLSSNRSDMEDQRSAIGMDIQYFGAQYFHIGPPQPYGFTRLVAARITGQSPDAGQFLPPVTITAYAAWYYDLHRYAYVLLFAVGAAFNLLYRQARRVMRLSPIWFAVTFGVIRMVIQLLSDGETAYELINWAFIIIVFSGLAMIAKFAKSDRRSESHDSRVPLHDLANTS